jgi:50S ribosomal protein L16 3-hydroxylase
MNAPLQLLGQRTAQAFLSDYWQRRPLLVRQALSTLPALDADELAGLACEDAVESRIITGSAQRNDWTLRHGPFDERDFSPLGEADWTLLVQAVDHYDDEVAALKRLFAFLPAWRLDDIMVSFAAPGGSVGPHFDQYDVFLIQGQGRRRWRLGGPCPADSPLLPHPDLRLLAGFTTQEDYLLEPGDMLYLPPGWAHWGVAEDACMTYSVGFRAPSHAEIVSHYCDAMLACWPESGRFRDREPAPAGNPGLIDPAIAGQLQEVIGQLLDPERLLDWFGCYMTEPKYESADSGPQHTALPRRGIVQLALASRAACRCAGERCLLYIDGERFEGRGPHWQRFVEDLCRDRSVDLDSTLPAASDTGIGDALRQLWLAGKLEEAA